MACARRGLAPKAGEMPRLLRRRRADFDRHVFPGESPQPSIHHTRFSPLLRRIHGVPSARPIGSIGSIGTIGTIDPIYPQTRSIDPIQPTRRNAPCSGQIEWLHRFPHRRSRDLHARPHQRSHRRNRGRRPRSLQPRSPRGGRRMEPRNGRGRRIAAQI